ncbi:MAG: hypothetical protein JEZ11_26570 [Desulfobacterales bacterium]|nr:hypothetical protein [Desulfobacterales bacterium]
MAASETTALGLSNRIWIISEGRYIDVDLGRLVQGNVTGPVKEYLISDIARYLLSPDPIEVEKRLLGCEVHCIPTAMERFRVKLKYFLPGRLKTWVREKSASTEVVLTRQKKPGYEPRDIHLKRHADRIHELIRPYDPVFKRLEALDPLQVEEIVGVCQDLGGNRSFLNIPGSPAEQIRYVIDNIGTSVRVVLEKAYMAEGLFELKGFDFTGYDPDNTHRLLKFILNGTTRTCVLNADHKVCWIDDVKLVQYMQLFEQSIRNNAKLRDSMHKCIQGQAMPMKLLFNNQLEIDYSRSNLPKIFRELFDAHNMGNSEKAEMVNYLNHLQIGVAFNYVPKGASSEGNLYTDISVMQDVRALDPIKKELPQLYSEMAKRASVSNGGRFYMLDAIRGIQK